LAFLFGSWQSFAIAAELAEPVFICAYGFKEKAAKEFCLFNGGRPMVAPTINAPAVSKGSG